jgi:hypothetical protein
MPTTLEQILGQPANYGQQLADYSKQLQQDMQNPNLAEYSRTGTYTPRTQQTSNLTFTQQGTTAAQTQPEQKQMSYADLFVATNPYRPQTAEEREAERKRNRRNAVFAAIGDGISALSNLYFTTKGAPNAYTGGSTLTGKMYERQEQLRKERQALDQQYMNAYMNAMKMDRDEDYKNQNLKMQLENIAYNRERQAKQDAREAELHPYKVRYEESRARAQEAAANNADQMEAAKLAVQESLRRQHDASAAASYARAKNYGNGSKTKTYSYYPIGNNIYEIEDKFWKDATHVSSLYSKLPKEVRYIAEGGSYSRDGKVLPPRGSERKKPTTAQMVAAIQSFAEENNGYTPSMIKYLQDSGATKIAARSVGSIWDGDDEGTETDW